MSRKAIVSSICAGLLWGCPTEKKAEPKPEQAASAPVKAAPPPPPAEAPAPAPAENDCVAAWNPSGNGVDRVVGETKIAIKGTRLDATSKAPDARVTLGVVADIKENTDANIDNLKSILGFFANEGAEAIVVAGDLGETSQQIQDVLDVLAGAGLPVFTIIGNREGVGAYREALGAIDTRHENVFDLSRIRLATFDHVALVSMPGYFNRVYIHAKDGCAYTPAHVAATRGVIEAAGDKTVVMVSHGPPRQDGVDALDRTLEQSNVGDPELSGLLGSAGVQFGIFANIHEAGGRATDLAGKRLVKPETWSEFLYLNPGPADAVAWKMNDGTESVGMAAVMRIEGKKASYKIHRITAD